MLLLIVVRQNFRSSVRRFFSLYLLSMIVWSFSAFMIFSDLGVASTVFWNRFLIIGSMAMPISFFGFTQAFLNQDRRRILWSGVVGYIIIQAINAAGLLILNAHVENGYLFNSYGPIGLTIS
ncbi:MAG TPA: histidine kinase N-terminal 7TM domain-containing protein, partial [Anaerolinea sp.]|nr:histidine kinase N-terminal 7TM domain-containing protein [Anaerolinea sp.]